MSGRCFMHNLDEPVPPVAHLRLHPDGASIYLCRADLDFWFDMADDDPGFEPQSWGWLR